MNASVTRSLSVKSLRFSLAIRPRPVPIVELILSCSEVADSMTLPCDSNSSLISAPC